MRPHWSQVGSGEFASVPLPRAADSTSVDTAVFSGARGGYTVAIAGGVVTVTDTAGTDGTDTLRNIEKLVFYDTAAPAAPVIAGAVPGDGFATVTWTAPGGLIPTHAACTSSIFSRA